MCMCMSYVYMLEEAGLLYIHLPPPSRVYLNNVAVTTKHVTTTNYYDIIEI